LRELIWRNKTTVVLFGRRKIIPGLGSPNSLHLILDGRLALIVYVFTLDIRRRYFQQLLLRNIDLNVSSPNVSYGRDIVACAL